MANLGQPRKLSGLKARFIAAIPSFRLFSSASLADCVALLALGYQEHLVPGALPQAQHERAPLALNRYRPPNLRYLCDAATQQI